MSEIYLALFVDDASADVIDTSDSFSALKKNYEDEPDIMIAKVIWESEAKREPQTYPVPEGECLDGLLSIQENQEV